MFSSVEMRWFYPGAVPDQVRTWFHNGSHQIDPQTQREDHYLSLPESDSLGVKLREGRVEVKQRYQAFGVTRLHERVEGRAEGWRKWSLVPAGAGIPQPEPLVPLPGWIRVRKERALARYRLVDDSLLVPIPAGDYPQRGCNLELTEVQIRGTAWWTAALEAFGEEPGLGLAFLAMATQILTATVPPIFLARDSRSYPEWLQWIALGEMPG